MTKQRQYNLVYLHARRKSFPAFANIATALQEVWPVGEVASVEEIESRLAGQWPANLVEAAIWKVVGDSAAAGQRYGRFRAAHIGSQDPPRLAPARGPASCP